MSFKPKCLDNPNNKQKDVVIITVPWTDSSIPLMSSATLKPSVEAAGYSCLAVDTNIEVYNYTKNYEHYADLIKFFFDEKYNVPETAKFAIDIIKSISTAVLSWKPKYVFLSLFSYVCRHSAKWIAYHIKRIDPSITIVIGGPGCLNTFTGYSDFVTYMLDEKLADDHIRGDGEQAVYEYLTGNRTYKGINDPDLQWQELDNTQLTNLKMPDYSDYIFSLYPLQALPIIGSRGCVKKCTFCDYIANWKQFHWRSAQDIFNEMITQYNKYKIRIFKFHDSVTNGNMKEFLELLTLLSEYNLANPEQSFKWSGYYILRDNTLEEEWDLLETSGAELLSVGIENLNADIREYYGKHFSNETIEFTLQQAKKHKITILLLMIVGYPKETQAHINNIKVWLDKHSEYKDMILIQWGGGLGIFEDTYIDKHKEELGMVHFGDKPFLWQSADGKVTPAVRGKWANELIEYSSNLDYNVFKDIDNSFLIEQLMSGDHEQV